MLLGATLLTGTTIARAQILGEGSPGTPGLIEGELRGPRNNPGFPPPLRTPDPPVDAQTGTNRFPLKRNANTAVRRPAGLNERVNPSFPGASPAGQSGVTQTTPRSRNPSDLTGTSFRAPFTGTAASTPARQPGYAGRPAPGLGPIAPVQQRRPQPEADPYAPVGIRVGSFLLRPALEISGGYDTNAARSPTRPKGSPVYRTEAELRGNSDWSQHRLDFELRGVYSGFTSVDNVNRPEGDARIALRLDVTRDLTIDSELRSRVETESATSINLPGAATGRTPFYTNQASLGATQRFGRLSIGLRGIVDRTIYGGVEAAGVEISQESRNLWGYGLRLRAGYELTPGITPFVEAGVDRRSYDSERDASGFRRSSQGAVARVGTTFELARTLTGEIAAGYTMRHYEDARLAALKSPTLDGLLTWSISPLTTLQGRAQTEIVETTVANSSGAVAYRGTLTLTHAFLRNFTATATLGMSQTDYQKISRAETTITGGLRLEYKINRMFALRTSYAYENFRVNAAGENYHAHTFLMGLRLTP
jgi:hypothetical protein